MRGGGRHELFMPSQPELAAPGFPCYQCNKWWPAWPRSGHRASPAMPSAEGKAPRLRCARHGRVAFQVKPPAEWTQEARSFVTRMYLSVSYASWKRTGGFGEFVQLWVFSESAVSSCRAALATTCRVLPVLLKKALWLFR